MRIQILALMAALCCLSACSILRRPVPEALPPLKDMEEPLSLMDEPQDEAARRALPPGAFTGIYVSSGAETLEELAEGADGVLVERIVENSPGAIAGIEVGDLLLEATGPRDEEARELRFPSVWREVELAAREGDVLTLLYDRAGEEREAEIKVVRRLSPPDRDGAERFREEKTVGVVLRTATEVEARAADLGPGGGAVIVGLSARSPWRKAGLTFGDLITQVGERRVEHPQIVLDAIRESEDEDSLPLVLRRAGLDLSLDAPLSRRESEMQEVNVPLLFNWESEQQNSEWSVLFGLFGYRSTAAAWRAKLLWFITFGGGEIDTLEEIEASELDENAQLRPAGEDGDAPTSPSAADVDEEVKP
jgi:C-terminal processing protease CtpA/Prc